MLRAGNPVGHDRLWTSAAAEEALHECGTKIGHGLFAKFASASKSSLYQTLCLTHRLVALLRSIPGRFTEVHILRAAGKFEESTSQKLTTDR